MKTMNLGQLVHSFFIDYLNLQKGLKTTSIQSYRDAIKLLLCFVAERQRRKVSRLTTEDFTLELVQEFLNHLERDRGNHIRTRNHRLAVLHTFFEYVARRAPETLATCQQIAAIPTKRATSPETHYLEREQVAELFRRFPDKGRHALRDHTLMLFLYNTGARAQEVAGLRANQLELSGQLRVRLHGKGDKWRICPLWTDTADRLQQLLQQYGSSDYDGPVFLSARGTALTRFGIYKIVRRHCQVLEDNGLRFQGVHISPHTFRHTAAVHLVESGTEVNVIRGWLGHVKLDTTNRYAEISLKSKEAALRACDPSDAMQSESHPRAVWKDDEQLLNWLDSL
jgi:site-specific recombinase XerD